MTKDSILARLAPLQRIESWQAMAPWANSLLVLMLAYGLAGIAWRLWPIPEPATAPLLAITSPTTPSEQSPANLDAIAALHLFGEVATAEAVEASLPTTIDAPETRLSLTLKGIVALSDGGTGRALIAEGARDEKVYKVGDSLTGGAVLHEVLADKVILKRGGRFETLTLPRERAVLSPSSSTSSSTPRASASRQDRGGGLGPQGAMQQQLSSLRERIAGDPQQAFNLLQAQPVMEAGAIKGYRVSPGKQRRLFHGTGLRAGDVVTSVNGISLSDASQMATLFAQFKTAKRFDLVVERGGRPTNLTIDLGQ